MWRRGGALAASVLLGAGCMLVAAHPAAAVTGSFTIVGGHTRWSFDQGETITVTGTTNTPDPGPVTALLDGSSTGSGTADSTGAFSLTFTLPDTTCADGEANTHEVGVSFADGASLPSQQVIYRCASYKAQPEFDGNAKVYSELIDIDRAGANPYVTTCIQATDPKNGQPLGQVVETGAPPAGLTVSARYATPTRGFNSTSVMLQWAGAAATVADAPGCYVYSLPVPSPLSSPFTPYDVSLTATLGEASYAGSQAQVLPEQLVGPLCYSLQGSDGRIGLDGFGFGSGNPIDVVWSYTAPAAGPSIVRRITGAAAADASTAATPPPAGDAVTSTSDGSFIDDHKLTQGEAGGYYTVTAYLVLPDGSGVLLPTSVKVPLEATCPAPGNGPSISVSLPFYAEADSAVPAYLATDSRYLTYTAEGFNPDQVLSLAVNGQSVTTVNAQHVATTDTTDGNGYKMGIVQVPNSAVSCRDANVLEASTQAPPPVSGGLIGGGSTADQALVVTCPSISDAPVVHPAVAGDTTKPVLTGFDTGEHITAGFATGVPTNGTFTSVAGTTQTTTNEPDFAALPLSYPTAPLECGSLTPIAATEGVDTADYDAPPAATLPVVALCAGDATLTASPSSFAYSSGGRQITLSGTGLRPGSTQVFAIDGVPATSETTTVSPNGSLGAVISETGLACGPHTVTANNQSTASDDLPGTAVITVTCPTAIADPTSLKDDDLPENIAVSGLGFDPGSAVTITLPDGQTKNADIAKDGTLAAANGTLSSGILPCGTGVATVTERGEPVTPQPSAQAAYVVQCPSPPTLTLTPPIIAATSGTRTVTITGTGWLPNSTQPVIYDGSPLATATVDAAGAFSVPATLTAPTVASHAVAAIQGRYRSASTLLRVTMPALAVNPAAFSRDAPPATITVSGGGYDPGYALDVAVPGAPNQAVTADSNGAFTTTVPSGSVACGAALTISGTEPAGAGAPFTVSPSATTPISVSCPAGPTVTPTPGVFAFVPTGHTVTLVGNGFRPNVPVTVSGDGFPTQTVTTDPSGNLTVTGRATGGCGSHSIVSKPSIGYAAASTYTVTCPALVSQPSALDGLHLPNTVTLVGSGYDPNALVTLVLAQPNLTPVVQAVTTNAIGGFTTAFPVAGLYCAPAPITGTESYPSTPPPTASILDTVSCPKPVLTVTPKTISDGTVAVYTGRNFHPGENVDLVWKLQDASNGLGDCQATVAPDTSIAGGCLVFSGDVLGVRTLVATDERDAIARTPVLVQQNPSEPGRQDGSSSGLSLLSRR